MPFSRLIKLQKNNIIKMFAAYENGEPCALAITCTGSKSVLLMYLAVDGNKRGQGLGSKIIPALCETFPRRNLLLEIEKPDENKPMTVRRKEFYLRCGLRETGTEISLAGVPMEILIKGDGEFDKYEYLDIYRKHFGKNGEAAAENQINCRKIFLPALILYIYCFFNLSRFNRRLFDFNGFHLFAVKHFVELLHSAFILINLKSCILRRSITIHIINTASAIATEPKIIAAVP